MYFYALYFNSMNLLFARSASPQPSFRKLKFLTACILATVGLLFLPVAVFAAGSVVKVSKDASGNFILLRDGKPYFINGRQWTALHKPRDFRVFFCQADASTQNNAENYKDKADQSCAWLP